MKKVFWFTGLSGSGKSTIAEEAQKIFKAEGLSVRIIDGDDVRNTIHKNLGFSREDIKLNNNIIAEIAHKAVEDVVLVPIISPFSEDRLNARNSIGTGFIEVYVNAPLEVVQARDTKGLYSKAQKGEIDNLIGVHDTHPYEIPAHPEIEIKTGELSLEESVSKIINYSIV